jgi:H/ACA ribonucleoprotein complex subunit 4
MATATPWSVRRQELKKSEDSTDSRYGSKPEERTIEDHLRLGMVNLDKPAGPTSHEVVAWVKRIMGLKKAGHGGTLEANAGETLKSQVFFQ